MKIDHVGYLVNDIEKGISAFKTLGYQQCSEVITDDIEYDAHKSRNVFLCFLENSGTKIELVSPINESSDVANTLRRQGEGPYHICYQTNKLDDTIELLKDDHWIVLKKPEKAVAFNYKKVAFLFKKSVGLIELVEIGENDL